MKTYRIVFEISAVKGTACAAKGGKSGFCFLKRHFERVYADFPRCLHRKSFQLNEKSQRVGSLMCSVRLYYWTACIHQRLLSSENVTGRAGTRLSSLLEFSLCRMISAHCRSVVVEAKAFDSCFPLACRCLVSSALTRCYMESR